MIKIKEQLISLKNNTGFFPDSTYKSDQ